MQVPTGFEVLSLVILTVGVVLSIWEGSLSGSTTGISIAVASTFCGAAMLNFSGKVQTERGFESNVTGPEAIVPFTLWGSLDVQIVFATRC